MFGSVGMPELIIGLVVILLLFGAKRVPELARGLGSGVREFKKGTQEGEIEDKKKKEEAKKDEEIPALIGQIYTQQAQAEKGEKQKELLKKAGDAFAASAEAEPDNAEAYLLAGQAYDQAGQPADAIEYYNGYLDLEPKGENAKKVKERISALLEGGSSSGSAEH